MAKSITSLAVGDIIKIREKGVLTDFVVLHNGMPRSFKDGDFLRGYDDSCVGVWVIRKENLSDKTTYSSSASTTYPDSNVAKNWKNM